MQRGPFVSDAIILSLFDTPARSDSYLTYRATSGALLERASNTLSNGSATLFPRADLFTRISRYK